MAKKKKKQSLSRRIKQWSKPLRYTVLVAVLKFIRWFTPLIPHRACLWLGGKLGMIGYALGKPYRERAIQQLQDRGMAETPEQARAMTRDVFRNLGRNALEWLHTVHWKPEDYERNVRWEGIEQVEPFVEKGRGVLFITGHMGNWEFFLRACIHRLENPLGVIWAETRNDGLNQWLCDTRDISHKAVWISASKGILGVIRHLKHGGCVTMLVDQDTSRSPGIFVDFFGVPAYTASAPAKLAWRTNSTIIPVTVARDPEDPTRHRGLLGTPIHPDPQADEEAETYRLTQLYSAELERHIRLNPEQWVWIHDRWHHKPGDRIKVRSAGKKVIQT